MFSGEGEEVPFCEVMYPKGNVEDWLLEVEKIMRLSLKKIIEVSLNDYHQVSVCRCTCISMFFFIILDYSAIFCFIFRILELSGY